MKVNNGSGQAQEVATDRVRMVGCGNFKGKRE